MRGSTRICVHLMHVFPFVIHSRNYAFCGIVLHNRKQDKSQFSHMPLRGYLRRQRNSLHIFPLPCFLIAFYNPITERTKNIPGSTSHKQVLRSDVVGVLICYQIYFDAPDWQCLQANLSSVVFTKRHATQHLLFSRFCDVKFEKETDSYLWFCKA